MAFNPSPTGYFPHIVTSSSGVFIPYSDFESYTISSSGDIKQLAYSFIDAVANTYTNLPSSGQTSNMTVTRSWSAQSNTVLKKVYTFSFNLAFSGISVTPE